MIYNLSLTAQDINEIGAALAQMPYGRVAALVKKIQDQVSEQEKLKPEQDQEYDVE